MYNYSDQSIDFYFEPFLFEILWFINKNRFAFHPNSVWIVYELFSHKEPVAQNSCISSTYWGRAKIAAILQTTFPNAFSLMNFT